MEPILLLPRLMMRRFFVTCDSCTDGAVVADEVKFREEALEFAMPSGNAPLKPALEFEIFDSARRMRSSGSWWRTLSVGEVDIGSRRDEVVVDGEVVEEEVTIDVVDSDDVTIEVGG
jgi:hypothetical protein